MVNFLHTFEPQPILFSLGAVNIYWYGLFIVLGIVAAGLVVIRLAKKYDLPEAQVFDLLFYLVLFGLIGARLYDVLLELPYYRAQPLAVLKVWQGGLAVHGAIIACALTVFVFAKRHRLDRWLLASLIATAAPLAQAIGRWGNYFNQELFGRPTGLPWGIPIDYVHRPAQYSSAQYFHPTFLYESVGNILIFGFLLWLHLKITKTTDEPLRSRRYALSVMSYAILYSILRFSLEFIKIDRTPAVAGLRWPQIMSIIIIFVSLIGLAITYRRRTNAASSSSIE